MQIENHNFIVTGAARGLGKSISLSLAGQGANVALVDMDQDSLNDVLKKCRELNQNCHAYRADISSEDEVSKLFSSISTDLGPVNGLINNAGILRDALLVKAKDGMVTDRMSLQQWQSVIDVNLTGVFLCAREAISNMIENNCDGIIVNISSISRAGNPGQSNYAAAKAGVAALTVTWAREFARYGIRCAAIAPGVIETEMVASMKPEAHERMVSAVPLKRTGEPQEIADTVNYIITNDYFNGRILELDGGLRL